MQAQTVGQVIFSKQALGSLKRLCVCVWMCESDRDWNDISGSWRETDPNFFWHVFTAAT